MSFDILNMLFVKSDRFFKVCLVCHSRLLMTLFIGLFSIVNLCGQSLFFDNYKDSEWMIENYTDSMFVKEKSIGLLKLDTSLVYSVNNVVWIFNDSIQVKPLYKDVVLESIKYEFIQRKTAKYIRIYHSFGSDDYTVGVVSTGSFVLLTKRKKK